MLSRSKGFTYLATPYTDPDPQVREARFEKAAAAAIKLMERGEHVYAPIVMSHPLELRGFQVQNRDFWLGQELPILRHASKLKVLCTEGWEESEGVAAEMELASELGIPIEYIEE